MAKIGDTVRFLNSVGGGRITRIEGKLLYVEEDGFETPVMASDVVVVLPAGHENNAVKGARLMFDQKAFDEGRREEVKSKEVKNEPEPVAAPELPVEETEHGEKMNIVLAFEPMDIRKLSTTSFAAVLVNDSNYFLAFSLLGRGEDDRGWKVVYQGEVAPNELIDLASYTPETLLSIERIAFQCIAFKKDKEFTLKAPVSVSRRIDITKFHKLHCFRPGLYFDTPVLELPLVSNDLAVKPMEVNAAEMAESMKTGQNDKKHDEKLNQLADKYRHDKHSDRKRGGGDSRNPNKLLPLIEVDLHIGELTDTTAGMEPKDMLQMQLDTVRRTMQAHQRRIGQKIVFIHGKGEGVLRNEVLKLLKKEYPSAELQDASFREYGFGATLVTIHQGK